MSRRTKVKLSFPKAIAVTAVFCALAMIEFQGPRQKPHHRKHSQISNQKIQKATVEDFKPTEPIKLLQATTSKVEVVPAGKMDCLSNLAKLGQSVAQETEESLELVPVQPSKPPKAVRGISNRSKKLVKSKHRAKLKVAPRWVEEDLESGGLSSQDALDNPSPLDELALQSFQESPDQMVFVAEPLMSSLQWQYSVDPNFPFELERPLYVKESEFQRMDFADLRESLSALKLASKTQKYRSKAPESLVAWGKVNVVPTLIAQEKANQLEIASDDNSSERGITKSDPENTQKVFAAIQGNGIADSIRQSEESIQNKNDFPEGDESQLKVSVQPTLASIGNLSAPELSVGQRTVNNKPVSSQRPDAGKASASANLSNQLQDSERDSEETVSGKIYGEVSVDVATLDWLSANKGFVELYLNKVGSRDPQDTIFLSNYQFPRSGQAFEIEGAGLKGKYNLVAGVYIPSSAVPVAQISYPKAISSENYREKIRLSITKSTITEQSERRESLVVEPTVPLNLTLFDGAPSNYRKPSVIKNGEVTFLGMPELGNYISDAEGNVRVPNVPVSSELLVEVKAPGYYPTRIVVPIQTTSAYSPVYLIEKDKVEVVTNYFTKKPQQSMKSVLMGRIYDSKSRTPLAGETLHLSYRKGSAVYFSTFPNLKSQATLETGLFGFYNIEPSFRAVGRSSNLLSQLQNFESGYGYFMEFGRGGRRTFSGRLTDPFNNQDVVGSVHLVGSAKEGEMTDEKGNFKLPELDFPPGVITFEANAEGYPRTWFTVPWSTREPEKSKTFYMIDLDLIKESAHFVARVKHEKNTGVIAGGAHSSLFKKGRERITVQLINSKGDLVSEEHGPFSLSQIQKQRGALVLSADNPGFTYFNLQPGEYFLKMLDSKGKAFKTHVVRVGVERISIVVN